MAILAKGIDAKGELRIGLMHFESDNPKEMNSFLEPLKQLTDRRVVVIGGHKHAPDDLLFGSEPDRDEILEAFKQVELPEPEVFFNPTGSTMDTEPTGDRYIDVSIDTKGRFFVKDHTKDPGAGWAPL